jgi:hypothetical protein
MVLSQGRFLLFVLAAALTFPFFTHAESVVWSDTFEEDLYRKVWTEDSYGSAVYTRAYYRGISNPYVRVQYHIAAYDEASGIPIACGSSVLKGTKVRYEFVPHAYEDVYWVGTGTVWDSPYGEWVTNAKPSGINRCAEKNLIMQESGAGVTNYTRNYAELAVAPPAKIISGLDSLECAAIGDSRSCVLSAPGTVDAIFSFAPTVGYFYFGFDWLQDGRVCHASDAPLTTIAGTESSFIFFFANDAEYARGYSSGHVGIPVPEGSPDPVVDFTVPVAAQSISCPITVIAADGNPPSNPALAASTSCTLGTPHSITMNSDDPDGDSIRYLIDWNNDSSVDQFIPSSGYVPSGTTLSASRTYSTTGTKTVGVRGEDEGRQLSSWKTVTFTCADTPSATAQCSDSADNDGDGLTDLLDSDCTGSSDTSEFSAAIPPPAGPSASAGADLSIRAVPSIVKRGNTSQINWSATGVTSCTTAAPNGDAWTGLLSPVLGRTSRLIDARTIYTLRCIDSSGNTHTRTATVNILPVWRER